MLQLAGRHIIKTGLTYGEACVLLDRLSETPAKEFLSFFVIGEANKAKWMIVSLPKEYVNNPHIFFIEE